LIFKPGFSKKYPQYEDMQPDLRVIKAAKWDFAVSRGCYFDDYDVLNSYYVFHALRRPGQLIFNFFTVALVFIYTFVTSFFYFLRTTFFFVYVPFRVLYIYFLVIGLLFSVKLVLVALYLVPILLVLVGFIFCYFIYRFVKLSFKGFNTQRFFVFFTEFYSFS